MAAVDLSATSSFPFIKVISSVGTTQQEVNLPPGKLRVSDGAAMPADKLTIAANNLLELELSNSSQDKIDKIAVAASTGTASISIVLERA